MPRRHLPVKAELSQKRMDQAGSGMNASWLEPRIIRRELLPAFPLTQPLRARPLRPRAVCLLLLLRVLLAVAAGVIAVAPRPPAVARRAVRRRLRHPRRTLRLLRLGAEAGVRTNAIHNFRAF